jgi:hypothetical protein
MLRYTEKALAQAVKGWRIHVLQSNLTEPN